jgi:hypothetical protein
VDGHRQSERGALAGTARRRGPYVDQHHGGGFAARRRHRRTAVADRESGSANSDGRAGVAGLDVARLTVLHRRHRRPDFRSTVVGAVGALSARRRAEAERSAGRPAPHRHRGASAQRDDPVASGVRAVADRGGQTIACRQPARRVDVAVRRFRPAAAGDDVLAPGPGQRKSAPVDRGTGRAAWRREDQSHARLPAHRSRQPGRGELCQGGSAGAARGRDERAARVHWWCGRGSRHLQPALRRRGRGRSTRQRRARGERLEDGGGAAGARRPHRRRLARGGTGAARRRRADRESGRPGGTYRAVFDDGRDLRSRRGDLRGRRRCRRRTARGHSGIARGRGPAHVAGLERGSRIARVAARPLRGTREDPARRCHRRHSLASVRARAGGGRRSVVVVGGRRRIEVVCQYAAAVRPPLGAGASLSQRDARRDRGAIRRAQGCDGRGARGTLWHCRRRGARCRRSDGRRVPQGARSLRQGPARASRPAVQYRRRRTPRVLPGRGVSRCGAGGVGARP